jgi:serine/threonine-protein kinase HipA
MTSEVFVYLMLPQETSFVTAGRFVLDVDRNGLPLGRFVYGRRYLERADAVAIDPIELPLGRATFTTHRLKGLFGALRDASPDHWGRHIIEKHSGLARDLGELDYLLQAPDDRAGALSFGLSALPPPPSRVFNRTLDLARLQMLADQVIADEAIPPGQHPEAQQLQDLLLLGTSMGGARPKAVVEEGGALWVAKFNRTDDPWNNARIEHAMLKLAHDCGLTTAHSRVIQVAGRDVLLVKRFDRERVGDHYCRARMLSALTLLRTGDSHQDRDRWSYVALAEELRRVSADPQADARELFRRMVFNALISNSDDHPRNHAILAAGRDWRLSPAYDLTPSPALSKERRDLALIVGDFGRYANVANLLSQCARFLLARDAASMLIDEMQERVRSRWYAIARDEGVSEADCAKIAGAFTYEGLRLQPP